MGLIRIVKDLWNLRANNVNNPNMWINTLLGSPAFSTFSGANVNPDTALKISTVFLCVKILSETVASLPLQVFKRKKSGGKDVATDHYLYYLLHDMPNELQNSYEFREFLEACLALRGNGYSYIERNGLGEITSLTTLLPQNIKPESKNNTLIYRYTDKDGIQYEFPKEYIWHLKALAMDGIEGLSPISQARESIGIAMSAEKYGAQFFGNTAVPGGLLTHPGSLKPQVWDRLRESVQAFADSKRHSTMILEEGMTWQQIGLTNSDSQFLETRSFQVEDIARFFNIPLELLHHESSTGSYAKAELLSLNFVKFCVLPWCRRWEASIASNLLTERDRRRGYFAEFNLDGLLRGDIETRYKAYALGRQWGWFSANDCREMENMNPIDGGDEYITQPQNIAGKPDKSDDSRGDIPQDGELDVRSEHKILLDVAVNHPHTKLKKSVVFQRDSMDNLVSADVTEVLDGDDTSNM